MGGRGSAMVLVDVIKESSILLCSDVSVLLFTTLLLLFPVSAITLNVAALSPLTPALTSLLLTHVSSIPAPAHLFLSQLAQTVATQALCFPVLITLALLAKTAIFYVLSCRAHGFSPSVVGFLNHAPAAWSAIALTHIAGGAALAVWSAAAAAISSITATSSAFFYLFFIYAIGLAHLLVVLKIAAVSAAITGSRSRRFSPLRAILSSLFLLKRRRLRAAMLLFISTSAASAALECAFQFRILGRTLGNPGSVAGGPSALAPIFEAPLLIFAHAFVSLFDSIMSFAFYHHAQDAVAAAAYYQDGLEDFCVAISGGDDEDAAAEFGCGDYVDHEDDEDDDDHFSIALEALERQCRKLKLLPNEFFVLPADQFDS